MAKIVYGTTENLYVGTRFCNCDMYELTYEPLKGPSPAVTLYVYTGVYTTSILVWTEFRASVLFNAVTLTLPMTGWLDR